MIYKINNIYKIVCNSCGEIFKNEFNSFYEVVDFKKINCWKSVKVAEGNWDEICPDCVEFEKRLRGK